jgi:hypothetical protein
MKKYYFIWVFIFIVTCLKSQFTFDNHTSVGIDTLRDHGQKVIQDHSGNYIACGFCYNPYGNVGPYDAGYIVKLSPNGTLIWKKLISPTSQGEMLTDIQQLPDKNYIVVGSTDRTTANSDVFLAKIDTNGNTVWLKQYQDPANDHASELEVTPDGKIIILGSSVVSNFSTDILLIKTDLNGDLIWRKTVGSPSKHENYTSLKLIRNNTQYLLGGSERGQSSGTNDLAVTRVDTSGNVLWSSAYITNNFQETYYTIETTFDGGYLIGGNINSGMIWRFDSVGTFLWTKVMVGNSIRQLEQAPDSGFYMISTNAIMKTDKNGNTSWDEFYNNPVNPQLPSSLFAFNRCHDKGFIITGVVFDTNVPYQNMWVLRTDSLGQGALPTNLNGILLKQELIIYPNPNKGSFIIYSPNAMFTNVTALLTNAIGKLVSKKEINIVSETIEFKEEQLPTGLYFIEISQKGKPALKGKVIIE